MDQCPYCQTYIGDIVREIVADHYATGGAEVEELCPDCDRAIVISVFIDIEVSPVQGEEGDLLEDDGA